MTLLAIFNVRFYVNSSWLSCIFITRTINYCFR